MLVFLIQLMLVQLLAYKARSGCSAAGSVGRTDGRLHTESEKCVE